MASAITVNAKTTYLQTLHAALSNGITPLEIKEVLYHAVPYAGMAKVEEMVEIANKFLEKQRCKTAFGTAIYTATRNKTGKRPRASEEYLRRSNRPDV